MNERCSCGSQVENVDDVKLVREWRREHRHEAPPLKQAPSGGYATSERSWQPIGFAIPQHTEAM